MRQILIIGAGFVANTLIKYLSENSEEYNWKLKVGDINFEQASEKVQNYKNTEAILFNVKDELQCELEIGAADVVISLLPASMHHIPAKYCMALNSHLITASYISKEIRAFDEEARSKNLLIMGEMGLDPGIDHMIIMKILNELKEKNAKITGLKSFTGGLIADESDNNPWHYKFTWAPRNVVLAGHGTAQYMKNGKYKFVPYQRLFRLYENIEVPGFGSFEAYANRDSLIYRNKYALEDIPTFIRGTLRKKGFCDSWSALVRLGLTSDSFPIIGSENFCWNNLIDSFLPDEGKNDKNSLIQRLCSFLDLKENDPVIKNINWLGILDERKIDLKNATPAAILQDLLEIKWKLEPHDKDLIVMSHIINYEIENKKYELQSDLTYTGKNADDTAMGRLVGMPLALTTKHLLNGNIKLKGVHMPKDPSVYLPIIKDLEEYGVDFKDRIRTL